MKVSITILILILVFLALITVNADENKVEKNIAPKFTISHEGLGLPASLPDTPIVGMFDLNRDGWVDVKIGRDMWRNENGKFTKWHKLSNSYHCFGDFDNDGDLDVLGTSVSEVGKLNSRWCLLRNDGSKFTDISKNSGLDTILAAKSHAFLDYDRDGNLDIYAAGYESPFSNQKNYKQIPDRLFKGNGKGKFKDVTKDASMSEQWSRNRRFNGRASCGVTITDIDNDGFTDIYVSNYRLEPNFLWHNKGDGTFEDVAEKAGITSGVAHSNGAYWTDIDEDGDLDLFVANLAHAWVPQCRRSKLFRNDFIPSGKISFTDITKEYGLYWTPSAGCEAEHDWIAPVMSDFDNNGFIDLFVTESAQGGTNHPKYDPRYGKKFDSGYSKVYMQVAKGKFVRCDTDSNNLRFEDTWGGTSADFDNDGFVDVLLGSNTWNAKADVITWFDPKAQKCVFLQNKLNKPGSKISNSQNFINITLTASDRALTGSIIQVELSNNRKKMAILDLGFAGYSTKSNQLHFGLKDASVKKITAMLPDGKKLEFESNWKNVSLMIDCSKKNRALPEKIEKLFHAVNKIKTLYLNAMNEENPIITIIILEQVKESLKSLPKGLTSAEMSYLEVLKSKAKKLYSSKIKNLDKNESKAIKLIQDAIKYEHNEKYYSAVKKYLSIIKSYKDTKSAEYATKQIEKILGNKEYGKEIADKIAGTSIKNKVKTAEKYIKKGGKYLEKAKEILNEIIEKHKYSSYAEQARKLLKSIK